MKIIQINKGRPDPMLRFTMPEESSSFREKADHVHSQLEEFLHMEALHELLGILETDIDTISQRYNRRLKGNGAVVETQELKGMKSLDEKKEILYPLFRELGFIDINKPISDKNRHILVLGGSLNACIERTECALNRVDDTTRLVDGLACYRPVSLAEKRAADVFSCETEFGAMAESFERVFSLDGSGYTENYKGDRNLNRISCVRIYEGADKCTFRIFAAPSSEPDVRRADTGDSFSFVLDSDAKKEPADHFLFITNNRYCNRQFLQLYYRMLQNRYPGTLDVIGCFPDDRVTSVEQYDPLQYLQDLIGIIDWTYRLLKATGR